MVSPVHLHRYAVNGWRPHKDTKIGIIFRDPDAQVHSMANRWAHVPGSKRNFDFFVGSYSRALLKLSAEGASLIEFERMIYDPTYLDRIIRFFHGDGIEISALDFVRPENKLPSLGVKTPRRYVKMLAETYAEIRRASKTQDFLQG